MTPDDAVYWGQQGLLAAAMIGGPMLLAALVVGATVSLMQAVTQVNEMTLVFVPKIIAVFLVVVVMGGWMIEQAVGFGTRCFVSIRDIE
ncbi:MAG: flagellar biosynthesis protein FliQ [Myxococcota bacterium]|nr:flagellar biosynthesis protein FliQ [Myxococcota bacterium]